MDTLPKNGQQQSRRILYMKKRKWRNQYRFAIPNGPNARQAIATWTLMASSEDQSTSTFKEIGPTITMVTLLVVKTIVKN